MYKLLPLIFSTLFFGVSALDITILDPFVYENLVDHSDATLCKNDHFYCLLEKIAASSRKNSCIKKTGGRKRGNVAKVLIKHIVKDLGLERVSFAETTLEDFLAILSNHPIVGRHDDSSCFICEKNFEFFNKHLPAIVNLVHVIGLKREKFGEKIIRFFVFFSAVPILFWAGGWLGEKFFGVNKKCSSVAKFSNLESRLNDEVCFLNDLGNKLKHAKVREDKLVSKVQIISNAMDRIQVIVQEVMREAKFKLDQCKVHTEAKLSELERKIEEFKTNVDNYEKALSLEKASIEQVVASLKMEINSLREKLDTILAA